MSERDPDGPPVQPRTRYSVRTWGALEPGDVLNLEGMPEVIWLITPSPHQYDIAAAIELLNQQRSRDGLTETVHRDGKSVELPAKDLTILDLMDHYRWADLIANPSMIRVAFERRDGQRKHRSVTRPRHWRLDWRQLVALGPDAHYDVCGQCGFVWPCPHKEMDMETRHLLDRAARACGHCGQQVNGGQIKVTVATVVNDHPREIPYHGRKGPCLNAARRLDPSVDEQRSGQYW